MYISNKTNVLQQVHQTEWQCRRMTKSMTKPEYWAWIETITSGDPPVVDYSGETGYTIVECTDEDVQARLVQLSEYVDIAPEGTTYNIKYYVSKRDVLDSDGNKIVDVPAHKVTDEDGNETDVAETYIQSHFVGQDDTKDARLLADEWTEIRTKRDRLLTESDWTQANDTPLASGKVTEWGTYRTSLRDLPSDQSSKTKYSDITWPTKP